MPYAASDRRRSLPDCLRPQGLSSPGSRTVALVLQQDCRPATCRYLRYRLSTFRTACLPCVLGGRQLATSTRIRIAVSWLEPRTHHQPEKLQKLSKNEVGFTPPIETVNDFLCRNITFVFNRVQLVHKGVPRNWCKMRLHGFSKTRMDSLFAAFLHDLSRINGGCGIVANVEIGAETALGAEFGASQKLRLARAGVDCGCSEHSNR